MRSSIFFLAGLVAMASAAPATPAPYVVVQNNCNHDIIAGQSENGHLSGDSLKVTAGGSHTFRFAPHWKGRVWAREVCDAGDDCDYAGIGAPASLAEFLFADHKGDDYYDISFVDGHNLPLKIDPIKPYGLERHDSYHCGSPTCSSLPTCPEGFEVKKNGKVVGCMSACTKYGTDEHCCTGDLNSPNVCKPTALSKAVKSGCPDAYSYAYDDATSTFMCQSEGYKVTFCPN
ncbi:hypothetical protein EC973_008722 [Apophysomyces ossiformis]|uniref:Thaumatin-like protein n=1 Tax=Apophysomyces ossiformis TaxID=679940 RepID=A0A8H7BQ37_9FUNG|nr:hypothetical protein EC973_008722 [Apophysomyces ossiformis]